MNGRLLYGSISNFPGILLLILIAWSIFWKGIALWRSARNSQTYWYIVMLLLSTGGLLEIIYLAFFQKKKVGNKNRS